MSLRDEIVRRFGVKPAIDVQEEIERRAVFLRQYLLDHPGLNGFVIGISGGLDSAVAAALAKVATDGSPQRTLGLLMPYHTQSDIEDARDVAEAIGIETLEIDIGPAVDAGARATDAVCGPARSDSAPATEPADGDAGPQGGALADGARERRLRLGNRKARQRMIESYDVAQRYGLLVLGTDHATEAVVGFYTKYGDGGVDIEPLQTLDKRQIRELAAAEWPFGRLPAAVREKVPTAGLWEGQTDEAELGMSYDDICDYLEGRPVSEQVAAAVERRYEATRHKRSIPGI